MHFPVTNPIMLLLSILLLAPLTNATKRGLPYNSVSNIQNFHGSGSQISWAYNWASIMNSGFPSYLEFVPMLFNDASGTFETWDTNVAAAKAKGSKHLLAFNEPDGCGNGQSCIDAQTAAKYYKQYMMPYAGKMGLGAPAVTNGPSGIPWLQAFIEACSGCRIDFVPLHWYDSATNEGYLKWYLQQVYEAGGNRSVWVTEFAGSGTVSQQITFLDNVIPWLDQQSWVERYAWEMAGPGSLVDNSGNPTELGSVFAYNSY